MTIRLDNPLLEFLGVELVSAGPRASAFALTLAPQHLNRQASLHGGLTATLLDAACGYAGLVLEEGDAPAPTLTISLAVNYIGKANRGRIVATGRVTSAGRKIFFSSAELRAEDGRLLATAQGSFKRVPASA